MTPEEKSKELIDKFSKVNDWIGGEGFISVGPSVGKKCAIICVEQIISELNELRKPEYTTFIIEYADPDVPNDPGKTMDGYEKLDYWEEVLEHIKQS